MPEVGIVIYLRRNHPGCELVEVPHRVDSLMHVVRNHPIADQYCFLILGPDHAHYFDEADRGTVVKDTADALSTP
jgi:hypothetical protein